MKKLLYILFILIPLAVNAEGTCSYEEQAELSRNANLISVNFEEIVLEKVLDENSVLPDPAIDEDENGNPIEMKYKIDALRVNVLNLSEDYYIDFKNETTGEFWSIDYEDTEAGYYYFNHEDVYDVHSLTYTILSSDKTNCSHEKIRLGYLILPRLNDNYYLDICSEFSDKTVCQKYVTIGDISIDEFYNQIDSYREEEITNEEQLEEEKENEKSIVDYIMDNIYYILAGLIIVVILIFIINIIIKRRRTRL